MKLDTLVLAGASTKGPAYIGIFKALREHGIIDTHLTGVKHIITCSVGMLTSLFLLLDVSLEVQEEATLQANFNDFIDIEKVGIHELLFNLGLFDNSKVASLIKGVLCNKYQREDMTLQELYELKPINLTVKCVNVSKSCNAYINHTTDPDISILTLLKMTTAIPFFFKPIKYKGDLYVDGGVAGGYPVELVNEHYLGFSITCNKQTISQESLDLLPIIPYYMSLATIKTVNYNNLPTSTTIQVTTDVHFSNFDVSNEKKQELIKNGYDSTVNHIKKYNLTNTNMVIDDD